MNLSTKSAHQADAGPLDELLKNFNYAPLEILRKYAASLGTDDHMEVLRALAKQAREKDEADNQVEIWERESLRQKQTRLVIRINNYTQHAFAANKDNLNLNADMRDYIGIRPWSFLTFKLDFNYIRELGSRTKDIYRHFIGFGDSTHGFRLDVGLRVATSFGVFSPTLTPLRTTTVVSTGATPITCAKRITYAQSDEPYRFTVELALT
ncbi:hypothetical protein HU762_21590 [Pseudomonas sp. SWRI92]|uniref:hypothetical protein n=1 Tax=Pseudomonas sp. SWRI92 TaxID=2745499 RepID=UPI0016490267|nr:hypothetical protein [Pseudomonas sp. SWRI92]MBC3376540.1 hypothetical protein [Pseudomonas sp. SWRI92]